MPLMLTRSVKLRCLITTTGNKDVDPWEYIATCGGSETWFKRVASYEFEHLHALWASSFTSIYVIQRNSCSWAPRDMCKNIHRGTEYKSKNWGTTLV